MIMRRMIYKFKIATFIGLLLSQFNLFLLAKDKEVNQYINCTTGTFYSIDQIEVDQDKQYVNDFDRKNQQFKDLVPNFVTPNSTISQRDLAILRQVRNSLN